MPPQPDLPAEPVPFDDIPRIAVEIDEAFLPGAAGHADATEALNVRYGSPLRALQGIGDAVLQRVEAQLCAAHGAGSLSEVAEQLRTAYSALGNRLEHLDSAMASRLALLGEAWIDAAAGAGLDPHAVTDPASPDRGRWIRQVETAFPGYVRARQAIEEEQEIVLHSASSVRTDFAAALASTLSRVRSVGGTLDLVSTPATTGALLQSAADRFPSDWVEASNRRGQLRAFRNDKLRAWYGDSAYGGYPIEDEAAHPILVAAAGLGDGETVPGFGVFRFLPDPGPGGERVGLFFEQRQDRPGNADDLTAGWSQTPSGIWERPRRRTGKGSAIMLSTAARGHEAFFGTPDGFRSTLPIAVHELTHRMEASVESITGMEREWQARRVSGPSGLEPLVPILPGEMARPDSFLLTYIGKEYPGQPFFEVMPVANEALLGGHYGSLLGLEPQRYPIADRDMATFALGVLACAGRASLQPRNGPVRPVL